jgi:serine/threonine protein kinase
MSPVRPTAALVNLVDASTRDLMVNPRTGVPVPTTAVVMEYFPYNLTQYLRQHGRTLTSAHVWRMCWQLLQAQLYIKSRGLCHLDIKVTV